MIENVIIIGGGPSGLSAAIYLARADLKPLVFAGSPPGGQLTLTSEVENYPGFESILGSELIEKMRNQAKKFGARIVDENVLKVDFSEPIKTVFNQRQSLIKTKSVIIATGAKALWLNLPSETRLLGKGVSACATCDGFFFREKTVAVIGGGDTALEEALTLTKFAKKVYIIHRRDFFRASKIMQERVLKNKKIGIIWNAAVEEILGEKHVEGIKIRNSKFEIRNLKLDGVFVAIGHKPDTDLFKDKIELDKKGYILTTDRIGIENLNIENSLKIESRLWREKIPKFDVNYATQTSVRGVFAAGDCVDHIYRQAATSVGTGVAAALDVERYLENVK
ncbi:MAG: thioredoxin-disulfide reductase [Patescibacteria group bacterium]|jgi:thioredoxin reductase (NADPH)